MKQRLLTDIELDVHELKYLMHSFSTEPTRPLSELLKRSIARMQGRLDELLQEVDAIEISSSSTSPVIEETVAAEEVAEPESKIADSKRELSAIAEEKPKSVSLGDSIKLAAGLRHSISLNDSFRFSRELFRGDTDLMNRVIEQISVMSSYNTAVAFLSSKVEIDEEKEVVVDFLDLLRKYFNQPA